LTCFTHETIAHLYFSGKSCRRFTIETGQLRNARAGGNEIESLPLSSAGFPLKIYLKLFFLQEDRKTCGKTYIYPRIKINYHSIIFLLLFEKFSLKVKVF